MNLSFVVCGATGSGKTTIVNRFIELNPQYSKAISCTTRPPRYGEVNGKDYFFETDESFEEIKSDMIENDVYNGYKYGIKKSQIDMPNKIAILTPNGIISVKNILKDRIKSIRILSLNIEDQLKSRNDSQDNINKRLKQYKIDLKIEYQLQSNGYIDAIVYNSKDHLAEAVQSLSEIVASYCKMAQREVK